jgi:hypothetical protein
MKTVKLTEVSLETAVGFSRDRHEMAMSTLIASEEWMFTAPHDGHRLGDITMWRRDKETKKHRYYGSVPCGKVKGYRIESMTDAEPEAETRTAHKGSGREVQKPAE